MKKTTNKTDNTGENGFDYRRHKRRYYCRFVGCNALAFIVGYILSTFFRVFGVVCLVLSGLVVGFTLMFCYFAHH